MSHLTLPTAATRAVRSTAVLCMAVLLTVAVLFVAASVVGTWS